VQDVKGAGQRSAKTTTTGATNQVPLDLAPIGARELSAIKQRQAVAHPSTTVTQNVHTHGFSTSSAPTRFSFSQWKSLPSRRFRGVQ
jgi:hypothetical protein